MEYTLFCPHCGMEYPGGSVARRCDSCGSSLQLKSLVENKQHAKKAFRLVDVISGEEFVPQQSICPIGREADGYKITDDYDEVSRLHCTVIHNEGMLSIQDNGSKNGTHVNGCRLADNELRQLFMGDVIVLGSDVYLKHIKILKVEED